MHILDKLCELIFWGMLIYWFCTWMKGHGNKWWHGQIPKECPVCGRKTAFVIKSNAFDPLSEPIDVLKCFSSKCKSIVKNWEGHENIKDIIDENNQIRCIDMVDKRRRDIENKAKDAELKLQAAIDKVHKIRVKNQTLEEETKEPKKEEDKHELITDDSEPSIPEDYLGSSEHVEYEYPGCGNEDADVIERIINSISDGELAEIAEALDDRYDGY
jgi:hypothetical protein